MKINFVTDIFGSCGDDFKSILPAGSAQWTKAEKGEPQSLIFICPCGCKKLRSVPVLPSLQGWRFDGNYDSPTLTPSIQIVGECGWHGFLTNGEWRTC